MTDPRIVQPEEPDAQERRAWHTMLNAVDAAVEAVGNAVPPTAGVRYVEGENPDDYDEGEMPVVLVCPWCKQDAHPGSLYVLEYAQAKTYADPDRGEDHALAFDFDRDRFDESETEVCYMHESCSLPLALPDGWGADYI